MLNVWERSWRHGAVRMENSLKSNRNQENGLYLITERLFPSFRPFLLKTDKCGHYA